MFPNRLSQIIAEASLQQISGPANSSNLAVGTYNYTFRATDSSGNSSECSYVLTVSDYPDINLGNDTAVHLGTQLDLEVKDGYENYLWSTGAAGRIIKPVITSDTTIWIEVTNEYGCTSYDTIEINISFVGVEEQNQSGDVRIYPNPTSAYLNIEFEEDIPEDLQLHVLNVAGQLVEGIPTERYPRKNIPQLLRKGLRPLLDPPELAGTGEGCAGGGEVNGRSG